MEQLYVEMDLAFQGLGIGKSLIEYARQRAERGGNRGFIVKASKDAMEFFERLGSIREEHAPNAYPHLFWLPFQDSE